MRWLLVVSLCALALGAQTRKASKSTGQAAPKADSKKAPTRPAGYLPLALEPANPHYFRFRGRPSVLITSGEHYGAVLNTGFDYAKYLDALAQDHLNLTRIFNGAYSETLDSTVFKGAHNTLAPAPGQYLSPWARGADGLFNIAAWDERYFDRLKAFVTEAGTRNIVVEVTLFSVLYGSGKGGWGSWNLNPLNSVNNGRKAGNIGWDRFNTLEEPALVTAQDALVRRTVQELNSFDNVYFEICNEPYFSGATARETEAWVAHLIGVVKETEAKLPNQHLIAENIANGFALVKTPNPATAVFNFHYASPPAAVALNYALRKPLAFDETSNGCSAVDRRREAWAFLLSGGAVYNNLDPSFTTGPEPPDACAEIRYQLGILQMFLRTLNLPYLQPDHDAVREWPLGASDAYALSEPGRSYAIYLKSDGSKTRQSMLVLDLPAGKYQVEWLNPRTGDTDKGDPLNHQGGMARLLTPEYTEDVALKMTRQEEPPKPPVSKTSVSKPTANSKSKR